MNSSPRPATSPTAASVRHPDLVALPLGTVVTGQVQDLPFEAPVLQMEIMRADGEGVGLRFLDR